MESTFSIEAVWEIVTKIYEITHILGFIFFVWAAVQLIKEKREYHKKIISLESGEGLSKRPVAITIGVGKDPVASVKNFLIDNNWDEIPIISWVAEGFLKSENYPTAMGEINNLRDKALKLGVSEVLLFYAGPVDLPFFIGASFKNWVPVKVFAFANGTYIHRFTLERETSRLSPIANELVNTTNELLNPLA